MIGLLVKLIPNAALRGGGQQSRAAPGGRDPLLLCLDDELLYCLVLFFTNLLSGSFASERGFHAFFLTGLQVKGVALYLFDDVFLLYFTFETAQSVFQRLTLLKTNLGQTDTPPNQSGRTE